MTNPSFPLLLFLPISEQQHTMADEERPLDSLRTLEIDISVALDMALSVPCSGSISECRDFRPSDAIL